MTAFKIIATNHTSFTVSDLDRSLAFFRDALGFEVTSNPNASRKKARLRSISDTVKLVWLVAITLKVVMDRRSLWWPGG